MDVSLNALLISLVGIALPALLSAAGYYLKLRDERLRTRRQALFFLLEIRHSLLVDMFDPKDATDQYIKHGEKYLSGKGIPNQQPYPEPVHDLICGHFQQLLDIKRAEFETDVAAPYTQVLGELAKEAPVLAYKLKGKERLSQFVSAQNDYEESVLNALPFPLELRTRFMAGQLRRLKRSGQEELLAEVDDSIRSVALGCGPVAYVHCILLLRKKVSTKIDFAALGLDREFDSILKALIEHVQAEQSSDHQATGAASLTPVPLAPDALQNR